jgi:NAD(P)-dependent dehydrogenase (short-subunit alcohol dehydrogenase family)
MAMTSFPPGARAAVIGASGGIGGALAAALAADPAFAEVLAFSRSGRAPEGLAAAPLDLTDEASVAGAAAGAGALDLVIVATGLLHDGALRPEKDMRALDADRLLRAFAVNAVGPALVGKHFLPLLPRRGRGVFACLSARVGSIGDNAIGGWYGYRASKAALNMILRNFAIEVARKRPEHVILGLQPGTVDTALSKPFQGAATALMTPEASAARLLSVIDRAEPDWSGGLYDWRGARLPW